MRVVVSCCPSIVNFLQSGRGFLAKWMGFSCKVDKAFLQSGRGFLAKWTGFSCKVDGAFLSIVKVKSTPSPRPKTWSLTKMILTNLKLKTYLQT